MSARRLSRVPESGTVKIANTVSKLKSEGVDIISFSTGEPDFSTPDNITKACVDSLNKHFTHYTPSVGIPELRKAVAEKSRNENNIPCEASNILITPAKQAIFMTALSLIDEGDEVILPDPSWVTYDACIRLAGGIPKYVKVKPENEYRITPEEVAELVSPATKMIFLNTPANPTGAVATEEDLKGIADIAIDHDLYVMSDEVYEKILFEGKHVSIASLPGMFERTITINGMSKVYAMTGWRIGWAVAPPDIFKILNILQTHSVTCCTSFAQQAGVEALSGPQDSVKNMVDEFRVRREIVMEELAKIPTLHTPKPKGAFYVFPEYDYKMNSVDLTEYLLTTAHVAVTPGSAFGPGSDGHIRISYACSRDDIREGLRRIGEALSKLDR
ncbi:aspartate aminotransferase [Candidatus Methanomassiliicoccus intestinalis]|uniref:Aminotransferase n=1 Tax=Methanomassiliicoccus intestinalis (strain Issoire-Mx1) TaxID=1295009 RepID=R9T4W9_METII|nr:pyridoxal phosphate-dependent aminotransferase [Candidatus Methanomassiliicoccus intestinalis]AGN25574.1 aspartate aminotransferase [Candidatus Methanomassiliicoccus intestinalis Issoire-Mx1]TQS80707.1 MAG: aspartate aminotransferase [Candidatus Methanomassiliicoccus intestinalis]